MHFVQRVIFLIFMDRLPHQDAWHKKHHRLEHIGPKVRLIPREVLIDLCPFLGRLSIVWSGNSRFRFVKIDHYSVTLADFNLIAFCKEGYFPQRVLLKVLFVFLLSGHEVDWDKFAFDLADINEGFDCSAWLWAHVPVEHFLLLVVLGLHALYLLRYLV